MFVIIELVFRHGRLERLFDLVSEQFDLVLEPRMKNFVGRKVPAVVLFPNVSILGNVLGASPIGRRTVAPTQKK